MKVVTFGEIMLRLASPGNYRHFQQPLFEATFGGGEANVAVSLSNYGIDTRFVTKVPEHSIGQAAINSLRSLGVDTSCIVRGGERLGIYYLEKGASQRASDVIYDRKYSSIAMSCRTDFDWEKIFDGVELFHFTGITPAMGGELLEICKDACIEASKRNIIITCDLNYRKKMWSSEEANKAMAELSQYIDVCIANEEDSDKVFGIKAEHTDVDQGSLDHESYIEVARKLVEKFKFKKVAITLRESTSADDNKWAAMYYVQDKAYFSKEYDLHIVDRVGGGDSFAAGLIYGLLKEYEPQKTIDFAVAASALKHTIEGDFNRVSIHEVEHLMYGDGSGRVQR